MDVIRIFVWFVQGVLRDRTELARRISRFDSNSRLCSTSRKHRGTQATLAPSGGGRPGRGAKAGSKVVMTNILISRSHLIQTNHWNDAL